MEIARRIGERIKMRSGIGYKGRGMRPEKVMSKESRSSWRETGRGGGGLRTGSEGEHGEIVGNGEKTRLSEGGCSL